MRAAMVNERFSGRRSVAISYNFSAGSDTLSLVGEGALAKQGRMRG